jgi:acyl carrier protein
MNMTTKMDYEKITLDTINLYIKEVKKKDYVANINSKLIDDLDIDSLDTIELALSIEEKFGIEISVDQMMTLQLTTVKEVVDFFRDGKNDASAK